MSRIEQIGSATLYLGDAYEIRPTLGWFAADVMDPPYLFAADGGGAFRESRAILDQIVEEKLDQGFEYSIINPLLCASVVCFCHNDQLHTLLPFLQGSFGRYAVCFWRKTTPLPMANKHYRPDLEIYIHAWTSGFHPQGTLPELLRVVESRSRRDPEIDHPTVKPALVMDKVMRNVAGRSVCDPFMGSGSTGVAAITAGRAFAGIEHNPKHFDTACRRIEAAVRLLEQEEAAA